MTDLTPREIVSELDRFIIGQNEAKRAVAVALRNRWRRKQLGDDLRDEVYPKNILMIGPTGVGKTEISRRLAKLAKAPFLKVEATKFTEVGYVGRDVDSIIRDLVDVAIDRDPRPDARRGEGPRPQRRRGPGDRGAGRQGRPRPDARDVPRQAEARRARRHDDRARGRRAAPGHADHGLGMPGMEQQMQGLQDLFGKAFGGRNGPQAA